MKDTQILMDMPITVEVVDSHVTVNDIDSIFRYFSEIDDSFSTYKLTSEISKINRGEIKRENASYQMKKVLDLCDKTKKETNGYFNIERNKQLDPSGLVKGWAVYQVTKLLQKKGFKNFYVDAGGDIQVKGNNNGLPWTVGIRNPFKRTENVKVLEVEDRGVATSGTATRGQHIYNPFHPDNPIVGIVSITVVGPNIYEADRFATAAFAMEKKGIEFIENLKDFEGYMIDKEGIATMTNGFEKLCLPL